MKIRYTLLFTVLSLAMLGMFPSGGLTQDQRSISEFAQRPTPPISESAKQELEARLAEARANFAAKPNNPDTAIWLGRRLSYLGRFSEAIEVYTKGIAQFPNDARLYRHRGHRYITLRRFDLAITDFEKAVKLIRGKPDEIEPDGQPNARNIPTSTLQFNIWYHLGLAHYLTGNNTRALKAYRECLKVSKNPDAMVATTHWLYMTLRRMNRTDEATKLVASISEPLDVIENDGYYKLLLMYKGATKPEALLQEAQKQGNSPAAHSVLYGVGNWYLYNGRRNEATTIFRTMLQSDQWTSFGYIAAESDVKRLGLDS